MLHFRLFQRFLSTLPARGATWPPAGKHPPRGYFYPRSPRGERPAILAIDKARETISIHAPREGSDRAKRSWLSPTTNFYPRSPRGERPNYLSLILAMQNISIHAPREGSDQAQAPTLKAV